MPHLGEMQALQPQARAVRSASPSGSPYSYKVSASGSVAISAGTVSLIEIGRAGTFVNAGVTAGVVPVSASDIVRVTYTVAPTMTFIPQ